MIQLENPYAIDQSAMPLATCMTTFRDFVIFNVRKFFDSQFTGSATYPVADKEKNVTYVELDSPEIYFSDDRIIHEMERFLHGYNNRFIPIEIPVKNNNTGKPYYMSFTGRYPNTIEGEKKIKVDNPDTIYNRRLTWCDIFFIAACEAVRGKHILITRFPINFVTK